MNINTLLGKILVKIDKKKDEQIIFEEDNGNKYIMYHRQDCCEGVNIESIDGDLQDLIGSPILLAEEVSSHENSYYESITWTFYKLATVKGYVTIRWFGSSNGYYSESVDFEEYNDTIN
jgi:hypothetical protein